MQGSMDTNNPTKNKNPQLDMFFEKFDSALTENDLDTASKTLRTALQLEKNHPKCHQLLKTFVQKQQELQQKNLVENLFEDIVDLELEEKTRIEKCKILLQSWNDSIGTKILNNRKWIQDLSVILQPQGQSPLQEISQIQTAAKISKEFMLLIFDITFQLSNLTKFKAIMATLLTTTSKSSFWSNWFPKPACLEDGTLGKRLAIARNLIPSLSCSLLVDTLLDLISDTQNNTSVEKTKINKELILQNIVKMMDCDEFGQVFKEESRFKNLVTEFASHSALSLLLSKFADKDNKLFSSYTHLLQKLVLEWINGYHQEKAVRLLAAAYTSSQSIGSKLWSQELFREIHNLLETSTTPLILATLDCLSQLCVDVEGRRTVATRLLEILQDFSVRHKNDQVKISCISILTKLSSSKEIKGQESLDNFNSQSAQEQRLVYLAELLKRSLSSSAHDNDVQLIHSSLETIAFLSLQASLKEAIVRLPSLTNTLIQLCKSYSKNVAIQYALVSIFAHLTNYTRTLSEEEEQVQKLREMSGEAPKKQDSRDSNSFVDKRCQMLIQQGIVHGLVDLSSSTSDKVLERVSFVFLNLVTVQKHRGIVVQQGIKSLIDLLKRGSEESMKHAAQSVAKIGITMDPRLAFQGSRSGLIVRPLIKLCDGSDQLAQFESLMALTNLASMDDDTRNKIYQAKGLKAMENLQLSDHAMVQRAATEAICNMVYDPQVFMSYAEDPTKTRILLALCDANDRQTRLAASGALAVLCNHPDVCVRLLEDERTIEIIEVLFDEKSNEFNMRVLEILRHFVRLDKYQDLIRKCLTKLSNHLKTLAKHEEEDIATTADMLLSLIMKK